MIKYEIGTVKRLTFHVDIPEQIVDPKFRLVVHDKQNKQIFAERCTLKKNRAVSELNFDAEPGDYFVSLQLVRYDKPENDNIHIQKLVIEQKNETKTKEKRKIYYRRKKPVVINKKKTDLATEYDEARIKRDVYKKFGLSEEFSLDEYYQTTREFKHWYEVLKKSNESVLTPAVEPSGQTRPNLGNKKGVITRLTPSAARPVKDSDDIFVQGIDFLTEMDFDLLDDDTELEVFSLLSDFMDYMSEFNEARFSKRTPGHKRVALRKYYRKNKQKILSKMKKRAKTVKGIIHDKERKRRAKYGQRADGSRQTKNNVHPGKSRRVE
jgi:hypothetical protein